MQFQEYSDAAAKQQWNSVGPSEVRDFCVMSSKR